MSLIQINCLRILTSSGVQKATTDFFFTQSLECFSVLHLFKKIVSVVLFELYSVFFFKIRTSWERTYEIGYLYFKLYFLIRKQVIYFFLCFRFNHRLQKWLETQQTFCHRHGWFRHKFRTDLNQNRGYLFL